MKKLLVQISGLLISLFVAGSVSAQVTPGIGAAEHFPATCIFFTVMVPDDPDYETIGDAGYVLANIYDVDDNKLVVTHSKKNNISLNCSAKLDPDESIYALDVFATIAAGGEPQFFWGKAAPYNATCDWLPTVTGNDPCNGGYGATITTIEQTGGTCNIPTPDGGMRMTEHWRQISTPGGRMKLYCHWNGKE